MKGIIVGKVPILNNHKGNEIDKCIKSHNLINYVIIDDMDFSQFHEHHKRHLAICNGKIGIDEAVVKRAIKYLIRNSAKICIEIHYKGFGLLLSALLQILFRVCYKNRTVLTNSPIDCL